MGRLAPSVEKPVPRLRLGFVVALLLVMAAGLVALLVRHDEARVTMTETNPAWARLKPHCTPLEVDVTLRDHPVSSAERAVCLALAGKIDRARAEILAMPANERSAAVQALFAMAHPIADAGDDLSAGPIMHLVVELWPDNYMAVFHAGMADYALGDDTRAQPMLEMFLQMYRQQDIWHERAEAALRGIADHRPLEQREAHFAE